jgi:uncharacterized SAM-binding protein YcdF (DUF218 family)
MYRFLVNWTDPYAALHLVLAVVLGYLWVRRKLPRRVLLLVVVPWMLMAALSMPLVGYVILGTLEWRYPPRTDWPDEVDAVVVLSGGSLPPDSVRPRGVLTPDSIYRCLHAADVYRHYRKSRPVKVVASGGKVLADTPGPALSELMRDFLSSAGVDATDLVVEDRSRTTHENADECAKLLRQRGLTRVVLVTDAVHMWRASLCFQRAGVDVVASSCAHGATELGPPYYRYLIPGAGTIKEVDRVLHEWLGVAWYWLRGYV